MILDLPEPTAEAAIEHLLSDLTAPMTLASLAARFHADPLGFSDALSDMIKAGKVQLVDLPGSRTGVQWTGPVRHSTARETGSIRAKRVLVRTEKAKALRAQGMMYKDIAKELGVSVQSAFEYVNERIPKRVRSEA